MSQHVNGIIVLMSTCEDPILLITYNYDVFNTMCVIGTTSRDSFVESNTYFNKSQVEKNTPKSSFCFIARTNGSRGWAEKVKTSNR